VTAVVLGLASALAFGLSDFGAGLLSRRLHFAVVGLLSQLAATVVVWAALPWASGAGPGPAALAWGAASGLGAGVGSLALYRGLGRGRMSVVAPLSAVGGAALPVLAGVLMGERLSALGLLGVVLALPALWLVARAPDPAGGPRAAAVGDGLLAGAGFGLLFIGLQQAGHDSGLWPVAVGQLVSLAVQVVVTAGRRPPRPAGAWRVAGGLGVGVLGAAATVAFFAATASGLLTVVAVLSSLYPAVTVLLAVLLLRERAGWGQRGGLVLAAVAVALVSAA
jgi:drug/metabolite transporter (DMT)-like permease